MKLHLLLSSDYH